MALYDHRVFKVGDRWWIAQVHSGSSLVSSAPNPRITHERVHFSSIDHETENSRTAEIPAGKLRRMSNRSLKQLLAVATDSGYRFDMYPYNAPWDDEQPPERIFADKEGLQWTIRPSTAVRQGVHGPESVPAVEVVCLDDSALARQVLMDTPETYQDALRVAVPDIRQALVEEVKRTFEDLPAKWVEKIATLDA
mgnify:CR=1 FL=1